MLETKAPAAALAGIVAFMGSAEAAFQLGPVPTAFGLGGWCWFLVAS